MTTRTARGTNSNTGAVTSIALTLGGTIASGELIEVCAAVANSATGTPTCSDTDGVNVYVRDIWSVAGGGGLSLFMFRVLNSSGLAATKTITVSWASGTGAAAIWVSSVSGMTGGTFDKTASGSANSASPSSGATATLSAAVEYAFAGVGAAANVTFSAATGGFTLGQTVSVAGISLGELFQETAATTALTAGCTISVANIWCASVETFQEGAAGAGAVKRVPNVPVIGQVPTVGSLA